MLRFATPILMVWCSGLVAAQQNPTYIYMYDARGADASTSYYYNNIDGVTGSVLQSSADNCGSTVCTPSTYTWPDSSSGVFGAWTASSVKCGSALRGTSTPCTVNLSFKSVANGGNNTWAPQYIFTQSWANYAATQAPNRWQPNHVYPIGFTMTCTPGSSGCPSTVYYYQVTASLSGGLCQSAGAAPPTGWPAFIGNTVMDGSCTWTNATTPNGAPLQDVVLGSDYPVTVPNWRSGSYTPGTIISDGLSDGQYYQEVASGCTHSVPGTCSTVSPGPPSWNATPGQYTCDNTCTWLDVEHATLTSATSTTDGLSVVASAMPAVWETPFSYSQQLFYQNALTHYAGVSSANQIRYIRTGVGVGEEASISGARAFETLLSYASLSDAQLKGIWTNQALQTYASNVATAQGLGARPSWVIMALINCGTGLSTPPGTDCTWADVEAEGALAAAPFYGGYGSQGLQSSDLFNQQNVAQCAIPFQGKSCCSNNWCETRHYMAGRLPYVELQEFCLSYYASGTSVTCIYDRSYPNASLSEVLALATQHNTNVIELGVPEFDCAFGSACPNSLYLGAAAANKSAIQSAAVGLPSSASEILGAAGLFGIGDIF